MSAKSEFDLVLSDGRGINFDLTKLKIREWREYVRTEEPQPEDDDAIIAKTCDLTAEEIGDLNFLDYRRLVKAFSDRTTSPLPEAT
jgi:hypothetical protein